MDRNEAGSSNPLIPVRKVEERFSPQRIFALMCIIPKILLALAVNIIAVYAKLYVGIPVVLLLITSSAYQYFLIRSHKYYLTAQQLILEKGVFNKQVNYLELYRIKDITVRQSLLQKVFRLMTISILSFDTAEEVIIIRGIKVSDTAQKIRNHVQECRWNNKVISVDK